MSKYIFITGGVVSGIGKGISGASLGRLLKNKGISVFMQKFDPYINVDPGNMSPYQHGEVFVTKDGAETDLDLGHYERFIDEELTQNSNITTGRIYQSVIQKERMGNYDGVTVQVVPHITDEIKSEVYQAGKESGADVIITEIGGTVGDIESLPFIEAIRQVHTEKQEDVLFIHTTLVPQIPGTNELKTKPTQHSYKDLMSYGIKADMIIVRAQGEITQEVKEKISLFCDIPPEAIIQSKNADLIYEVPIYLKEQKFDDYVIKNLGLEDKVKEEDTSWEDMVVRFKNAVRPLSIGLVGKYTQLADAYLSVMNAIRDCGYENGYLVDIDLVNSEEINKDNVDQILGAYDGIVVPGGFGTRGTDGLILTSQYARQNDMPYLGLGLGMHMAVIDVAKNVLDLESVGSTELESNLDHPIIDLPEEKKTMHIDQARRLGDYESRLVEDSLAFKLYERETIVERHRHAYEINPTYEKDLAQGGLVATAYTIDQGHIDIMELQDHPYFVITAFLPEYRHRPNRVHPLFNEFVRASAVKRAKAKESI